MTDLAEIERALANTISTPWRVEERRYDPRGRWWVVNNETWIAIFASRGEAEFFAASPGHIEELVDRARELDTALTRMVETAEAAEQKSAADERKRVVAKVRERADILPVGPARDFVIALADEPERDSDG